MTMERRSFVSTIAFFWSFYLRIKDTALKDFCFMLPLNAISFQVQKVND